MFDIVNEADVVCDIVMFGLCPNILSFLWFFLVFIPLCPKIGVLFLLEFSSNQIQFLAQWSLGIGGGGMLYLSKKFPVVLSVLFRIFSGS